MNAELADFMKKRLTVNMFNGSVELERIDPQTQEVIKYWPKVSDLVAVKEQKAA